MNTKSDKSTLNTGTSNKTLGDKNSAYHVIADKKALQNSNQTMHKNMYICNHIGLNIFNMTADDKKTLKTQLHELRTLSTKDLLDIVQHDSSIACDSYRVKDMIHAIIKHNITNQINMLVQGVLHVINDSYGFIKYASDNFVNSGEDIFVPAALIKKMNLRTGDLIHGHIRLPEGNEKHYALSHILSINHEDPKYAQSRHIFESMTALYPSRKINLEVGDDYPGNASLRILDIISPIGFGQRALIVAPPKTGKTTLMQNIAYAIHKNHPNVHLMVLLIGERPEEVTETKRSVHGDVFSSTFDESAAQHVHVAEITIARAKRLAEAGHDVVLLMDSLTRFARSNNSVIPASGRILTGGLDVNAMLKPKQFFGAARNIENGGSLTIIATTLIETGSQGDEVIFHEFKGTGNCEISLDRKIAAKRIYPAIDIQNSSTRREELLIEPKRMSLLRILHRVLSGMTNVDAIDFLLKKITKTQDNDAFFNSLNQGG